MTLAALHKSAARAMAAADLEIARIRATLGGDDRDAVSAEEFGRIQARRARRAERRTAKRREADAGRAPWLRRDRRSHVVWTTATRSRRPGARGITGYWLFEDGKTIICCGTGGDWRAVASFAASYSEILVWDNPTEAGK